MSKWIKHGLGAKPRQYPPITQKVFVGRPKEFLSAKISGQGRLGFIKPSGEEYWTQMYGFNQDTVGILHRKFTSDGMTWDEAKECAERGELEYLIVGMWASVIFNQIENFPYPDALRYDQYRKRKEHELECTEQVHVIKEILPIDEDSTKFACIEHNRNTINELVKQVNKLTAEKGENND